jgi:hypothetical protein
MNGGPSLPSPGSLIHLAVEVITWQGGAGNVLPPGTPALVVEVQPVPGGGWALRVLALGVMTEVFEHEVAHAA